MLAGRFQSWSTNSDSSEGFLAKALVIFDETNQPSTKSYLFEVMRAIYP